MDYPIRECRWEVRFMRPDGSNQTIATYRVPAASKPQANKIGWVNFNRDHPGYAFGVCVTSYELK